MEDSLHRGTARAPARVLSADVGGTTTRWAWWERRAGALHPLRRACAPSARFASLEEVLAHALAGGRSRADRVGLAVAGPADGGPARLTNLGWHVDPGRLEEAARCPVRVLNDVEAVGYAVVRDPSLDVVVLQPGAPRPRAPLALLAVGTGLGQAYVTWHGARPRVWPSEGGHAGFAPRTAREARLATWLRRRHGRASWERVLSGPGLVDVHTFVVGEERAGTAARSHEAPPHRDPSPIVRLGLAGEDASCVAALALFAEALGSCAGDTALALRAEGGVLLAGGIPPRILPALRGDRLLRAFRAKGRLSEWMQRIPLGVLLDPHAGVRGAAWAALEPRRRRTAVARALTSTPGSGRPGRRGARRS